MLQRWGGCWACQAAAPAGRHSWMPVGRMCTRRCMIQFVPDRIWFIEAPLTYMSTYREYHACETVVACHNQRLNDTKDDSSRHMHAAVAYSGALMHAVHDTGITLLRWTAAAALGSPLADAWFATVFNRWYTLWRVALSIGSCRSRWCSSMTLQKHGS